MRLALAFIVTFSCASGKAAYHHEQISRSGEVTLRQRDSGGVVVLVVRSLGEVLAAGDATVLVGNAAMSPHVRLAAARAWLSVSAGSKDREAYTAVLNGLSELGNDYAPRKTIDDTDNLLKIAAEATELAKAAAIARKALATRIALYLRRYEAEVN